MARRRQGDAEIAKNKAHLPKAQRERGERRPAQPPAEEEATGAWRMAAFFILVVVVLMAWAFWAS